MEVLQAAAGVLVTLLLVIVVAWRGGGVRRALRPAPKATDFVAVPISSAEDRAAAEQKNQRASQLRVQITAKLQVLADEADVLSRP